MSHYRKIDVRIWNDEKFSALTIAGKLAFVMLLTHPMMTALGAMRGTPEGIAAELGRGQEGLSEAFLKGLGEIFQQGMAEYDEKSSVIALPNFLRYNLPESPNVVKAWVKSAEMIPEGRLKEQTIQRAVGHAEGMSKGFKEAIPAGFRKAYPKASPNQRTESSEQRTERKQVGSGQESIPPTHARARETAHPDWSEDDWRSFDRAYANQIAKGDSDLQARTEARESVERSRRHRRGVGA